MIRHIKNFLDVDLISYITDYVNSNIEKAEWKSSLLWPESIRKKSSIVTYLPLENESHILKSFSKKYYDVIGICDDEKHKMEINYYIWPNFSYIPWHNDSHRPISSTIYLNREWHLDYGGFFLYQEDYPKGEYKAIPPEFNSCIINDNHVYHGTSLTSSDAPYRETIQVFFHTREQNGSQ